MVRTQILLEETQHARLKSLAARLSTTVSELVRNGVDQMLEAADRAKRGERGKRWERLWEVVGTCHDREEATDVAVNHDSYLARIYSDE